jgi:predicted Zn-dependent protease
MASPFEPPRSLSNDVIPVIGADSPIVDRGFDARARQSSKSPRAAMEEFQQHFENERFPEALATLESVLRDQPDDPKLLYLIAVTHRAADHSHQAAPTLERVIAIDPQHLGARKLLCIIWTEDGRCTEAEAQINPLIAAGTADAEAWALRGAARLRCGDLANAAADAAQSLQIDPQMHKALLVRCAVQMRQGQFEAAQIDLAAARKAGAPDASWQPLSQELARKLADQQRKSGAPSAP